jgi:hypothetical protein
MTEREFLRIIDIPMPMTETTVPRINPNQEGQVTGDVE